MQRSVKGDLSFLSHTDENSREAENMDMLDGEEGSNIVPPQTLTEPATQDDPDVFRILVATDIHLGYAEKDAEIAEDSFRNFEYVLRKAREMEVDFLLLGGDLFHENKPSKATMHRCMTLLRTYCFGDKPIRFQIMSNSRAFSGASAQCGPNWLDENVNISLPCLTIHGNHDDPTGREFLCPLDALADSRLVNYFGKQTQLERLEIYPIVLCKGSTQLALYGLGAIRDERLYRLFKSNKVVFKKCTQSDQANWFNLLVLHQNRVARGNVARIPEEAVPSFFDLVLWGHEHNAIATPDWNVSQRFYVIQPGSTISTSLDEHERGFKYCGLLEVRNKNFRWQKLPVRCTRQLIIETISLRDAFGDPNNPRLPADNAHSAMLDAALRGAVKSPGASSSKKRGKRPEALSSLQVRIEEHCAERVRQLIEEAKAERDADEQDDHLPLPGVPQLSKGSLLQRPEKALVRLRVDYAGGFETFNASRFGQRFALQVANPDTIVKFVRKNAHARVTERRDDAEHALRPPPPDDWEPRSVEEILCELLDGGSVDERDRVRVLNGKLVAEALAEYVSKASSEALDSVVSACVRDAQRSVLDAAKGADAEHDADIVEITDAELDKLVKRYCETVNLRDLTDTVESCRPQGLLIPGSKRRSDVAMETASLDEPLSSSRAELARGAVSSAKRGAFRQSLLDQHVNQQSDDVQLIDDDDEDDQLPASRRKRGGTSTRGRATGTGTSTRGRGRGRSRKTKETAYENDSD